MKKKSKLPFQVTTKNSKILHDTMVTLGALKEQTKLNNLPMNEIQVHLLDKDGDGIVLCLEYDELTGELNKTFHSIDAAAYDEYGENENYEVELEEPLDPYAKVPNVKEFLRARIEETISEEYDEIFHSSDDEEPLLN
jgi:hypothetical protein